MNPTQAASPPSEPPLCVDLDGTLIHADLLAEMFFALLRQQPLALLQLPGWLAQGKACLKQRMAARVELDIASLPYHAEFLEYLREERQRGRTLVLATASNQKFAHQIAAHLGLFSQVHASDEHANLSGEAKRVRLVECYGERGYDYAGNGAADVAVWRSARQAIVVNASAAVSAAARQACPVAREFPAQAGGGRLWLKTVRAHQWLKNLLVFLPLIASHQMERWDMLSNCLLAFMAFSLCASSVYLFNDLLDLEADRHHPRKRHRPLASGAVSIWHGAFLAPTLLGASLLLGSLVAAKFALLLLGYYLLTLAYSLWLKQFAVLDLVLLAGFYILRILGGYAVTDLPLSFWLLSFAGFIFVSLAIAKRYVELALMQREGKQLAQRRGYRVDDLPLLRSFGTASGYMSVLLLALYVNHDKITKLYSRPEWLWLLCPLLLYWMTWVWLSAYRGEMDDDPVLFAVTQPISLVIAAIGAVLVWMAV